MTDAPAPSAEVEKADPIIEKAINNIRAERSYLTWQGPAAPEPPSLKNAETMVKAYHEVRATLTAEREKVKALEARVAAFTEMHEQGVNINALLELSRRATAAEAQVKEMREALERSEAERDPCPFAHKDCKVKPDEPCPVCGDVNDFDAPTNCYSSLSLSRTRATLAATREGA